MGATKKNAHLFWKLKVLQKVILEIVRTTQSFEIEILKTKNFLIHSKNQFLFTFLRFARIWRRRSWKSTSVIHRIRKEKKRTRNRRVLFLTSSIYGLFYVCWIYKKYFKGSLSFVFQYYRTFPKKIGEEVQIFFYFGGYKIIKLSSIKEQKNLSKN